MIIQIKQSGVVSFVFIFFQLFQPLIGEKQPLCFKTMVFPSEAISRTKLLTVYKNTWLQEAAPLESIIRHRNLDTLGNP